MDFLTNQDLNFLSHPIILHCVLFNSVQLCENTTMEISIAKGILEKPLLPCPENWQFWFYSQDARGYFVLCHPMTTAGPKRLAFPTYTCPLTTTTVKASFPIRV